MKTESLTYKCLKVSKIRGITKSDSGELLVPEWSFQDGKWIKATKGLRIFATGSGLIEGIYIVDCIFSGLALHKIHWHFAPEYNTGNYLFISSADFDSSDIESITNFINSLGYRVKIFTGFSNTSSGNKYKELVNSKFTVWKTFAPAYNSFLEMYCKSYSFLEDLGEKQEAKDGL